MHKEKVFHILSNAYDETIAQKILDAFVEIESNYFLEKWKPSELDAGHFVESVRRLIECELKGTYTPFGGRLPNFNDNVLKEYENQTGHESFRLLIPRILKSIYNIRNKRGVGHIKDISPNEMDSTLILYSVKWILSEIVRIKSTLSIPETQDLVDKIVERNINIIWKGGEFTRILDNNIPKSEQVLILLYDNSPQDIDTLKESIEYKNKTDFKRLLKKYHTNRLLELSEKEACTISPKGVLKAEELIKKYKSL